MKIKTKFLALTSPVYYLQRDLDQLTCHEIAKHESNNSYWLDLGCGLKPYESEFKKSKYIGIDVEHSGRNSGLKKPDLFFNGVNIPFEDKTFNGVLCTQVLEHVKDPNSLMKEIHRVLIPEGKIIVSVPFIYREHEEPYDYFRFSKFGLENLLTLNGFSVKNIKTINTNFELIAMLSSSFISSNIGSKNKLFFYLSSSLIFMLLNCARLLNNLIPYKAQIYSCVIAVGAKSDQ
jgi:SAM-dependent methyltransferase